jgi:hypothetical protein
VKYNKAAKTTNNRTIAKMNASFDQQNYQKNAGVSGRGILWMANLVLLALLIVVQCVISPKAFAETNQYFFDDDHLGEAYAGDTRWSSSSPGGFHTLYETTLPNFFGQDQNDDPKISISIQQLDDSRDSALMDDEKQKIIRPFSGDPLDKKALVIEVPFD